MEAMQYENNDFAVERNKLDEINSTITEELTNIENNLDDMPNYWQDEKSEQFIADAKDLIAQIKVEQEKAMAGGKDIFAKVHEAFNSVYQG